ncbi:MAG: sugar phosphate isomerase/epimerase, partial [Clostridia bacterium]|nr:sugar phosphate isomerase/epimerase [Clostridia bacterium]
STLLQEFHDNGAEYLILATPMLYKILEAPAVADQLLQEIQAAGLSFLDAHGPFMGISDLCYPEGKYSQMLLWRHLACLNIAADFGIKTYALHSGGDFRFPAYSEAQLMDEIRRKLDVLLPEAEKRKIVICLENGMPKLCYPDRLLTLKNEYPTPYLGFCYDSGHANIMDHGREISDSLPRRNYAGTGYEPEWEDHALEKMLPHIVNCHLHDNNGYEDQHLLPGRGNIDWKNTMELLKRAPRLEVIQSEVTFPLEKLSIRQLCETFRKLQEM